MTKRQGFTLAEVLITLGIIGVVAAMTIPNLIANTNGAKFRSGFKKAISTLNQAGLMAQAQYDFDYAGTSSSGTYNDCATDHPEENMTFCAIFNGTLTGKTYLGPINNIQVKRNTSSGASVTTYDKAIGRRHVLQHFSNYELMNAYTLADGTIVAFNISASGCSANIGQQFLDYNCTGFIDVNGTTLPNKEVQCSDGVTTGVVGESGTTDCYVKNNANDMTDIFPIIFHDATVEPASNAAKYVLTTSK